MGVPRDALPKCVDIQILTAQLHKVPLLDDHPVGTEVVIGPSAEKPLVLEMPLFVSDMSFGALSEEAKTALAIGCLGMRACHTNNCPVGIATQQPHLRQRLEIQKGAEQLNNFFRASTDLTKVMARACGHEHLKQFCVDDLTTWDRDMAHLSGVAYGGVCGDWPQRQPPRRYPACD